MSEKDQHQSSRTVRAVDLGESVLDQVERTGEPVTVLRGSRPVALLVPIQAVPPVPPQRSLVGTVEILGDIIEPVVPPEAWDAETGRLTRPSAWSAPRIAT